jgi:hypothetical protein
MPHDLVPLPSRPHPRTLLLPARGEWCRTIEAFLPGHDRVRFVEGFLRRLPCTVPAATLFRVADGGSGALLAAESAASGWRFVALFDGVAPASLRAAIADGSLFGADPVQRMKRERSALAASGATRSRTWAASTVTVSPGRSAAV